MSILPRIARLALPAALLLAPCASLRAEEPAPKPPADAPEKADKPDKAEADKASKDAEFRLRVLDAGRKVFVRVVITPKWDEDAALEALTRNEGGPKGFGGFGGRTAAARLDSLMDYYLAKRTISVPGVLIGKGLVAIEDDGTGWEWKLIGKIEVADASGRSWPAKVSRLLTAASAYVFAVDGANPPEPPAWRADFKLGAGERTASASIAIDGVNPEKWYVSSGGALLPFDGAPATQERLTFAGRPRAGDGSQAAGGASPGVVFDSEVRPVGVTMAGVRLDNAGPAGWQPAAMLASGAADWAAVEKAQARASAETLRICYKVRFECRVEKDDEEGGGMGMPRMRSSLFRSEGPSQDAETFGVSIGGGRIFIPQMLDLESVRTLDKVSVKVGGEWKPAAFVGAFRELQGMLITVKDVKLEEPAGLFETKGVSPMTPFIYCQAEELLGKVATDARTVRFLGMRKGYADRLRPEAPYVPQGALLFDLDGKLVGISLRERPAPTLLKLALRSYGEGLAGDTNLAGFAELKDVFADPQKAFEPSWRPMTRHESRRLCWLGIEFEAINEELAERLGCSEETRGGNIGLIVSTVYPGSPAERLGIHAQDILLRLKIDGLGDAMPLMSRYAAASDGWGRMGRMGGFGNMGMMGGGSGRTWKPRANFLTRLLTDAGAGRKAEVTYLVLGAKKETKTGAFEVAWAPEDYDSAERYKDDRLGMAVKPITYEVRAALGLKPEDAGVVISWIEQGSSAQVARLTPYMLVLGVEGRAVSSAADFKKALEEVRAQKKDSVKMQISQMGKCRFADLKLGD